MPRDMCPHYPTDPNSTGTSRCRACGVQISVSASEGQPRAAAPGVKPAAGTAINAALTGAGKIDGKAH